MVFMDSLIRDCILLFKHTSTFQYESSTREWLDNWSISIIFHIKEQLDIESIMKWS